MDKHNLKKGRNRIFKGALFAIAMCLGANAWAIEITHNFILEGTLFGGTFKIDDMGPFTPYASVPGYSSTDILDFQLSGPLIQWTKDDFIFVPGKAIVDDVTKSVWGLAVIAIRDTNFLSISPGIPGTDKGQWLASGPGYLGGGTVTIPEPDALALLGIGLLGLGFSRSIKKRRRSTKDLS